MTRFGLDSTGPVPVWAHHAAGSSVAIRYLSRSPWKVIKRSEYEADKAAGISTYLVFEDMGRPDLLTYADGKAEAEYGLKQALDILGMPALPPCFPLAYDSDPTGRAHLTDAYYDGAAAVLGRACTGPYGGDEVIRRQADRGFQILFPTYAWSAGRVDPRAQKRGVYQYANGHVVGGVQVDYNHIYGEDFGQWDRKPPAPVDPHGYLKLTDEGYAWKGRLLPHERPTVEEYDRLRVHPHVHRGRLHVLRTDLGDLADHVRFEAYKDRIQFDGTGQPFTTPAAWGAFHRGFRYQQLIHRAQGKRVV